MTQADTEEAVGILGRLLAALLATLTGQAGRPGAALRYAVGDLRANAATAIRGAALGAPLLDCFTLATAAGADLDGMDRVRAAMLAETPTGRPGQCVAAAGIRLALGRSAVILAATRFVSTDDVAAALTRINDAFDQAEEFAADNRNPAVFQGLTALHAAVVYDLATRARPLPRLVRYAYPRGMTAHALANRLYGDAARADELVAENRIIHPAFCPPTGRALSE